jgi:hypothetical protein
LEEIEKTGIGLENDRKSTTLNYVAAAVFTFALFLQQQTTPSLFFYFLQLRKEATLFRNNPIMVLFICFFS